MRKLMRDLGIDLDAVLINCDNQEAIKLLNNPIASQRSKHIDVLYHFARERAMRKEVRFTYVPTNENVADIMTKPLVISKFNYCRDNLGVSA